MAVSTEEIRRPEVLGELDLAVLHALQVAPRASWQRIGEVLGVDAATPARRWARLTGERLAWGTVWPTPERHAARRDAALVQLSCEPGRVQEVAAAAAEHPWALSVDEVSGDRVDLSVVALGTGLAPLTDRVRQGLLSAPGVRAGQVRFVSVVHREDSQWRLRVLSGQQRERLLTGGGAGSGGGAGGGATPPREQVLDEITQALAEDVRMPVATLGRRLGVAEVTARRVLGRALGSARLRLGCDVAGAAVGLGRGVQIEACAEDVRSAGATLAGLPSAHRVVETVADAPLVLMARFTSLGELAPLEVEAQSLTAGWSVQARRVVVRTVKRNGHLLDADGRMLRRLEPLL